ncbi:membrane protein, putative [hydrothermal vent metagenome]|uniref:Membrane protein, putative n=1 Tax=hydrothermal vent metagenome TaxID=652676 RepID=A0A3B0SFK4_9ZZZZ
MHAAANQTVDIVLSLLLLSGGVIGAQIGARAGRRLKGEQLRALLALIVLGVCARLVFGLVTPPTSPFIVVGAP